MKGALVLRTTDQTFNIGWSPISFNSAIFDTAGMWHSGQPTRLTITEPGDYLCGVFANVVCVEKSPWDRTINLSVVLNGSTQIGTFQTKNNSITRAFHTSSIWRCSAGDYLQSYVYVGMNDQYILSDATYTPVMFAIKLENPYTYGASPLMARVKRSNTFYGTPGSKVYIPFEAAMFDTGSFWDTANPTRLTVPKTAYYLVNFVIAADSINGFHDCQIEVNRTYTIGRWAYLFNNSRNYAFTVPVYLTADDYVEVSWTAEAGSTPFIMAYPDYSPQLTIVELP